MADLQSPEELALLVVQQFLNDQGFQKGAHVHWHVTFRSNKCHSARYIIAKGR